ncbi:FxsA family membrane protein [Streptomyces sp. V4-01]|uniref:FxsA family membrane protein n=1 Tax=Actinacidiphila polyblastidii TaxID=3110430 RepID=A0ABU7PAJ2_9ACTN|nr:FxsA family membrane protein [Streptomyces sp. V4-01]
MTTSSPPPVRPQPAVQPKRRRPLGRLLPLAVAIWAVLEIWLLIVVSDATSGFIVFLCILAGFVLGAAAVKRAGRSAWRNLTASVQAQQAGKPAPEHTEGGGRTGLHMLGGILLIIPGFLSDAVALLLLFPPTRKLIGALGERAAERHLRKHPPQAAPGDPGSLGDLYQQAREAEEQARIHRPDGKVIQGEVIDRD